MKSVLVIFTLVLSVLSTNAQSLIVRHNSGKQSILNRKQNCMISLIDPVGITKTAGTMTSVVHLTPIRIEGTTTIKLEQLMNLPQRNINAIAGTVAGVDSRDGQIPNIRGARQDGTAYYIDGVRVANVDLVYDLIR